MRGPWRKVPVGVLDPALQLGHDAQALADASQFVELRSRLLAWQRLVGRPNTKVSRKLAAAVADQPPGSLEETRATLAATLLPVTRAYLLTQRFTLSHYWMLDDFTQARFVRDFLYEAKAYARDHDVEVETTFQSPIRSIGRFGWTGSAKIRAAGTAGELQAFVHKVCRLAFVGLEPSSLRGAFMEEIPTFAQARSVEGYVHLTDDQLLPDLTGSKAAEQRDHDATLQRSTAELHALVVELEARNAKRAN